MKDGYLDLGRGSFKVGPSTTEKSFADSSIGARSILVLASQQFRTYKLPTQVIGDRSYVIALSFEDGRLRSLRLCPVDDGESESWASYSEAEQLGKKAENDRWLLSVYGVVAPCTFPWGVVLSVFDAKSGASEIIIQYTPDAAVEAR